MSDVRIIGYNRVNRKLTLLKRGLADPKLLGEIGEYMVASIEVRTLSGKDADGSTFKPYTPKYALFRADTGHQTSPVNLKYDGVMLSSMTYDIEGKDTVKLFFQNVSDKKDTPVPLKAYFLNEERQFFAISIEDQKRILDIVNEFARRKLRKGQ